MISQTDVSTAGPSGSKIFFELKREYEHDYGCTEFPNSLPPKDYALVPYVGRGHDEYHKGMIIKWGYYGLPKAHPLAHRKILTSLDDIYLTPRTEALFWRGNAWRSLNDD